MARDLNNCLGLSVKPSRDQIRLHTSNAYGSTATMIRRFTTVVESSGSAIRYVDDPVFGASFTIMRDGYYSIAYFDNGNNAMNIGISLNSTELSTTVISIDPAARLQLARVDSTQVPASCSWSGWLSAKDVIRAHTDSTAVGTNAARVGFTISKVPYV